MSTPLAEAVPADLRAAIRDIVAVPRLLVALDFDGTLAPEVDSPAAARALPESAEAVQQLRVLPDCRVALVSGRALDSLIEVSGFPPDVLLVGSHGIEYRLDDPNPRTDLSAAERDTVRRLGIELRQVADGVEGAWIEDKPAGFALHTRLTPPGLVVDAQARARRAAHAVAEGLTERDGKNIVEFSVRTATKGDAVRELRSYVAADAVFYAGDDVTDEDAFAALGDQDVGVKCGAGDTSARFRVAHPAAISAVLGLLASERRDAPRY